MWAFAVRMIFELVLIAHVRRRLAPIADSREMLVPVLLRYGAQVGRRLEHANAASQRLQLIEDRRATRLVVGWRPFGRPIAAAGRCGSGHPQAPDECLLVRRRLSSARTHFIDVLTKLCHVQPPVRSAAQAPLMSC